MESGSEVDYDGRYPQLIDLAEDRYDQRLFQINDPMFSEFYNIIERSKEAPKHQVTRLRKLLSFALLGILGGVVSYITYQLNQNPKDYLSNDTNEDK